MNKPHIHAELSKAWADGAEIEVQTHDGPPSWMPTEQNIGRARELYNNMPRGQIIFRDLAPWVVRVLAFLLVRYINQD